MGSGTPPGERAHLRSPLAHPTLLALAHRRPLDQSSHPTQVQFRPLASAAKMGSHDGVISGLHRTRREVSSKHSSELRPPLPRLIFSFLNLSRCLLSTAVVRPPISFLSNRTLGFHPSLTLLLYPLYCRCCLCFSLRLLS